MKKMAGSLAMPNPLLFQRMATNLKLIGLPARKQVSSLINATTANCFLAIAKAKKVLNTFCYSGGFSVYALNAGAKLVDSVDCSAKAIKLTDTNMALNAEDGYEGKTYAEDTFKFLKENGDEYDIVVVDPPAFICKHRDVRHKAVIGYKRLNEMALRKIKAGGMLFTFSCSQVVDRTLFENTVRAAAIEAGREVSILHYLHQPSCHPVNLCHPEGEYLKGLVLKVGK